ncbi:thioredoxin [Candidatus Pacearchaeota archaeon]|jgi:thioredoxin 1|nr:thioredoxin [Candidatus Pacearchaeota archaeon]|tara:strand:- start:1028 stop:1354 length:327 start_codon:yes stop_codon:yes gene_type:complete
MAGKNLVVVEGEKEFNKLIGESNVVVDFHADWCGPCKILNPIIEKVAPEFDGTVKFAKIDVDKNQDLAQRFQVMTIPTVIFFKEGKQVERFSGALLEDELKKKIDESF